jgi:hypothetical protein
LSSHYSYGFSAHYRRLNHDNPRCQLDSRIALQIPFTYQTLSQIPRGLAFRWPGGYIAHHNCEIGFPGVVASSQSHTTPQSRLSRVLHFSRIRQAHLRANPRPVSTDFPRLFSNATIFVIRRPSNGHLQAFPIAAKTPTLAVTLISCMKLIAVFRLHNLLWGKTGLGPLQR